MISTSNYIAGQEWIFLIIITVIIVVIIAAVKNMRKKDVIVSDDSPTDVDSITNEQNQNSLKILRERLAKGEITKAEYDELSKEFQN